jgi:hypothetical protein
MNRVTCLYPDREAVLVAYLYDDIDDIDAADRVAFETHVTTCLPCRSELADLRGVRTTLGQWVTPESPVTSHQSSVVSRQLPVAWWHSVPVWAQVAAAMLVLGVSASIANLDVRYDRNGLNIRTGWSAPAPAAQVAQAPGNPVNDAAPWRAELTALRSQIQSELRAQSAAVKAASTPAPVNAASATSPMSPLSDDEFGRRVRVLLADSEKKQQKELAVRLVQLQVDFNAQLQVDRSRTNQLFRDVTNTLGPAIMNQQRQVNYQLPVSGK